METTKISEKMISDFELASAEQLVAGWYADDVIYDLRRKGCPEAMTSEVLKSAKSIAKSENQADGRKMLLVWLAITIVSGFALYYQIYFNFVIKALFLASLAGFVYGSYKVLDNTVKSLLG